MCVQPPVCPQHPLLLLLQRSSPGAAAHEHLLVLGEEGFMVDVCLSLRKLPQQLMLSNLFSVFFPPFRVVHCDFRGEGAQDEGGERRQGVRGRGRQQGSSGPAQKPSGGKQR